MKGSEDRKIILRLIRRKVVETFLLVLGLALGIGASAAGIALAARSAAAAEEELSSPRYREILVSTRESADEMDTPLVLHDAVRPTVLTSIDLAAAGEAPDIAFSYVKSEMRYRNEAMMVQRIQRDGGTAVFGQPGGQMLVMQAPAAGGASAPAAAPAPETAAAAPAATATDTLPAAAGAAAERFAGGFPNPPDGGPAGFDPSSVDLSGPLPVPEEWYGYAVTPEYFEAWGLRVREGSLFTLEDIRNGANLMVLGSSLAESLYEDGEALGRKPAAGRTIYTITGILEPTGTAIDNLAFSPAFMPDVQGNIRQGSIAGFRERWNTTLSFMAGDPSRIEEAASQLESYFTGIYGEGAVVITVSRDEARAARDRNGRIVTVILFLALTGLFIAGVNVSNTLLSRAIRRQKTVGILKALGASRTRIFRLFFTEAFIIGVCGTAAGLGFSLLLSALIRGTTNLGGTGPLELAMGVGISWVISTILIVFPSLQASGIPAAEAMRNE